jgi:hypothetical protein
VKQVYTTHEFVIERHNDGFMTEEIVDKPIEEIKLLLDSTAKNFENVFVYDNTCDLKLGYVKGKLTNFPTPYCLGGQEKKEIELDNWGN